MYANKLSLNIDKTNFLVFHSAQKKVRYKLSLLIANKQIRHEKHVRYLGLIFDSNLNWKKHIYELGKKVSRGIGILSKIRHLVNSSLLIQLYYSLIYPFLTYGLLLWGNNYQSNLKPIVTLQKKAIRIITFSKQDEHSESLFKRLDPFHVSVS